jgi:hypothetical protein
VAADSKLCKAAELVRISTVDMAGVAAVAVAVDMVRDMAAVDMVLDMAALAAVPVVAAAAVAAVPVYKSVPVLVPAVAAVAAAVAVAAVPVYKSVPVLVPAVVVAMAVLQVALALASILNHCRTVLQRYHQSKATY